MGALIRIFRKERPKRNPDRAERKSGKRSSLYMGFVGYAASNPLMMTCPIAGSDLGD